MAAPRQAAGAAPGRIELLTGHGFDDALEGLDAWDYAWVLFVFHENVAQGRAWRPKVQPPRLSLGPHPHAYRRIRRQGAGYRLALKEWRIDFAVDDRVITVDSIASGYRPRQLATDAGLALHRDFVASFTSSVAPRCDE
jgi:hypothetical protein